MNRSIEVRPIVEHQPAPNVACAFEIAFHLLNAFKAHGRMVKGTPPVSAKTETA